jgi:hypothetical protein
MQEDVTVLATWERPVYHVESGLTLTSLTAVILYQRPDPVFVLTREISTPNATDVTVTYMVIPGTTLKECCENMAQMSSMILSPVRT